MASLGVTTASTDVTWPLQYLVEVDAKGMQIHEARFMQWKQRSNIALDLLASAITNPQTECSKNGSLDMLSQKIVDLQRDGDPFDVIHRIDQALKMLRDETMKKAIMSFPVAEGRYRLHPINDKAHDMVVLKTMAEYLAFCCPKCDDPGWELQAVRNGELDGCTCGASHVHHWRINTTGAPGRFSGERDWLVSTWDKQSVTAISELDKSLESCGYCACATVCMVCAFERPCPVCKIDLSSLPKIKEEEETGTKLQSRSWKTVKGPLWTMRARQALSIVCNLVVQSHTPHFLQQSSDEAAVISMVRESLERAISRFTLATRSHT